jgi:hypothetical protein
MLKEVFKKFDKWIEGENTERDATGAQKLKCDVYIIGQTALLEAKLQIQLAATMDVDLFRQLHGPMREKLDVLFAQYGKKIDPVGHEAWMPIETQFDLLFSGKFASCFIAKPEYILISKAKKAPIKNKNLIIEYIGNKPSKLFFDLAKKYEVRLEDFLK